MLIRSKNGQLIDILRSQFINDISYYNHILLLKFNINPKTTFSYKKHIINTITS